MRDSCSPRKLEPGFEQTYSMLRDLRTSIMKSEPLRSSVRTSTRAGVSTSASRDMGGGGFFVGFAVAVFAGVTAGVANAAAPAAAFFRKSRRLIPASFALAIGEAPSYSHIFYHTGYAVARRKHRG